MSFISSTFSTVTGAPFAAATSWISFTVALQLAHPTPSTFTLFTWTSPVLTAPR